MTEAARFLNDATPHHDRWFLFVDEFDPHEPFDTPAPWAGMYETSRRDDDWIIWPPYADGAICKGLISDDDGRHVRANYGSKLSMIDHWFGRVLDAFDAQDLWADTALIVCTDHGHYLGDEREGRDIWGKPGVPQYEPIGHTPLLIHWPGREGGGVCDALTTNVDLFATIADIFDAEVGHRTHGHSMVPLLTGSADEIRTWAIGGYFGSWVQITDGRRKYTRGPVGDNYPLSMWSNRWSTLPIHIPGITIDIKPPDDNAWLDRMPGSDVPVIRQPYRAGDALPFWASGTAAVDRHFLFDLSVDPNEAENRSHEAVAAEMADLLRSALVSLDAPDDQFDRLALA
jgi:arylsulfatase A-like enzyme